MMNIQRKIKATEEVIDFIVVAVHPYLNADLTMNNYLL